MKPARHPTALRTAQLLHDAGVDARVVEFEQPTRTSAEAAAASGDNRVSEAKVARSVAEPLLRADAEFVRTVTGYAIGGVAPIGHAQPVKLLLDADLRRFGMVWAAAGTPYSVFPVSPEQLRILTGAEWSDVRQ